MNSDVAKLLEAGRITKPVAERLSQLAPGNFCVHKSYGAGKIVSWDFPTKKVTIDFENASNQSMDLQFALQRTEYIPEDDFRAKKLGEVAGLSSLAKSDPVKLIVHILESHGGKLSTDGIEKELSGAVIPAAEFKKWWESAKKALKESRLAIIPGKRTEAIVLRSGEQTPAQSLMAEFESARDIRGMIKGLEAITADIGAFDDEMEALRKMLAEINEGAKKAARVQLGQALQLIAARDEVIASKNELVGSESGLLLSDMVASAELLPLAEEVGSLPSARQRAVFESFPAAFADLWVEKIVQVFDKVGARGVTEISRLIIDRKELPALAKHLSMAIARRSLGPDALIWVCRERKASANEVFNVDVGASILNLLENDHLSDGPRKTTRLQSLLTEDKTLLADLVNLMDKNETRNFSRRLLDCPVFADLEKKSLMARIIKVKPDVMELVSGANEKRREETLLVSWASLEKKKTELDELIRIKIPQNVKDISIAREYGDLRENFEYHSARDLQKVLQRRKGELERDISNARGTDFKGSDASSINSGTIVSLKSATGELEEMTVLGAWDSNPDKKMVSYLSEVGKSLMGKVIGETIEIRDGNTEKLNQWTVTAIRPFNP